MAKTADDPNLPSTKAAQFNDKIAVDKTRNKMLEIIFKRTKSDQKNLIVHWKIHLDNQLSGFVGWRIVCIFQLFFFMCALEREGDRNRLKTHKSGSYSNQTRSSFTIKTRFNSHFYWCWKRNANIESFYGQIWCCSLDLFYSVRLIKHFFFRGGIDWKLFTDRSHRSQ